MSVKHQKLESTINREITRIIQYDLKDPNVGFCTITEVKVTNDNSFAKVYITFLGQKARQDKGIAILNKAKGHIRSILASRMQIRKVPEIIFELDETFEKAQKIEKILGEINQIKEEI